MIDRMARIAIDCDGVLADFNNAALKVARKLYPEKFSADFKFDTWDWFHPHEAEVWAAIDAIDNFWYTLDAYREQINELAQFLAEALNHTVWIVTARKQVKGLTVAKQTEMWWKSLGIDTNNYVGVIPVPHPSTKAKLYKELEIQYSIDDNGPTVESCDKLQNHKAFLLNRPWNQGAKVLNRVDNIARMCDIIEREGS